MNPHRQAKNKQLTRLASEVTDGIIVELGAYQGEGTAALAQGASVPIYAIDDYRSHRGWAGEAYGKDGDIDKFKFFANIRDYGLVTLIMQDAREAARARALKGKNISLLVWDLGMENRLLGDFEVWQHKVTGKFVIHDTDKQLLGSKDLNPTGWRKYKEGVFWILEREQ